MQIDVKQINSTELAAFVLGAITGGPFIGLLNSFTASGGSLGSNVVYSSGADQSIAGQKTFITSPYVPYTGVYSGAAQRQWVLDTITGSTLAFSGFLGNAYVTTSGTQTILGTKTFSGIVNVPTPAGPTQAVNVTYVLSVSGALATLVASASVPNVVTTTGYEFIGGIKTFTGSPLVPNTTLNSGAVNYLTMTGYVYSALLGVTGGGGGINLVYTTGNQSIAGVKTFQASPSVPPPVLSGDAVNLFYTTGISGALYTLILSNTGGGGGSTPNVVFTTGNQTVGGIKTFTGSPNVPRPILTGDATNLDYVTGISGYLLSQIQSTTPSFPSQTQSYFYAAPSTGNGLPLFRALSGADFGAAILTPALSGLQLGYQGQLSGYTNAIAAAQFAGGSVTNGGGIALFRFAASTAGTSFLSHKSRSAILGGHGGVLAGDVIFDANITASDGTGYIRLGRLFYQATTNVTGGSGAGSFNVGVSNALGTTVTVLSMDTGVATFITPVVVSQPLLATQAVRLQDLLNASGVLAAGTGAAPSNSPTTLSFFLDPIGTGLNLVESHVGGLGFFFTGAAFACRTSGFGPVNGGILSGKLYQVDSNNTEQTLLNFTLTSGVIYSGSPTMSVYVTGRNRVGVSLTNSLSGIGKLSIGVFGGPNV